MEIDLPALAQRFVAARTAAELSQGKLGEEFGLTQSFVSAIEKERVTLNDLNIERIQQLAERLGVDVPYKTNGNGHADLAAEPTEPAERELAQDGEYLFAPQTIVERHFGLIGAVSPAQGLQYEIEALRGCVTALERLEPNSRRRVLAYLQDVFAVEV